MYYNMLFKCKMLLLPYDDTLRARLRIETQRNIQNNNITELVKGKPI